MTHVSVNDFYPRKLQTIYSINSNWSSNENLNTSQKISLNKVLQNKTTYLHISILMTIFQMNMHQQVPMRKKSVCGPVNIGQSSCSVLPPLGNKWDSLLSARCRFCHPIKCQSTEETQNTDANNWPDLMLSACTTNS